MGEAIYTSAAIAICVSIIFGIASHVQQIALDHMDVRSGTIVNIATTAAIMWLLAPLFLVPETLVSNSAALFALSGLIVPAVSISFATLSVRTIGPGLTAGLFWGNFVDQSAERMARKVYPKWKHIPQSEVIRSHAYKVFEDSFLNYNPEVGALRPEFTAIAPAR